jgi:hypothetical protein
MSPWLHFLLKSEIKADDLSLARSLDNSFPDVAKNLIEIERLTTAREDLRQQIMRKQMEIVRAQVLYDDADARSKKATLQQEFNDLENKAAQLCSKYDTTARLFLNSIGEHKSAKARPDRDRKGDGAKNDANSRKVRAFCSPFFNLMTLASPENS